MVKKRLCKVLIISAVILAVCVLIYVISPACMIKSAFGIECPACGTSRMVSAVLSLDFNTAFQLNPFMFIALPVSVVFAIYEMIKYVKNGYAMRAKWEKGFLIILLVLSIIFMIFRNLFL